MKYIKRLCFVALIFCQTGSLLSHMKPIKKDGRYYYSSDDTYNHISFFRLLGQLSISPSKWKDKIKSWFNFSKKTNKAYELLNPTQTIPKKESDNLEITWIGHASFLIQIDGFNILTDPIFGDTKAGPITISSRAIAPGIKLEDLPHIDAIVISHNHSDHTDTNALKALGKKYDPTVYVPEGNKELFTSFGFSRVVESTWWEKGQLSKGDKNITFTCLPAYHWSIRFSLSSYRRSLCASWMISTSNKNIYFAGDTAQGPHFKEIAADFPSIDIALMPIGPTCEGENKHKVYHIDAREAVDAFIDLNASCFIPMHYGTFFSEKEMLEYPISVLRAYWEEKETALDNKTLLFARCGQSYRVS